MSDIATNVVLVFTLFLVLFTVFHIYIYIKTWSQLSQKANLVYLAVNVLALAYIVMLIAYIFAEQTYMLNYLSSGLLVLAALLGLFPDEIITIQKNEITNGGFVPDERKEKLLSYKIFNPNLVRFLGIVFLTAWAVVMAFLYLS